MKTHIFERILILSAYKIQIIPKVLFSISLLITGFFSLYFGSIPLVIGYLFWFSFGFWGFSFILKNTTAFLRKKYDENNEYYHNLLRRKTK